MAGDNRARHNFSMARKRQVRSIRPTSRGRIFLKQWRIYRGLTQEQLAERVNMSVSNISQLEQGRQGYSQEGLEALANALRCEPGQLLSVDPTKGDAIWSIWEKAAPGERQMIIDIATTITQRKTGT